MTCKNNFVVLDRDKEVDLTPILNSPGDLSGVKDSGDSVVGFHLSNDQQWIPKSKKVKKSGSKSALDVNIKMIDEEGVSISSGTIIKGKGDFLYHTCSTQPGFSGAPVRTGTGDIVGIHCGHVKDNICIQATFPDSVNRLAPPKEELTMKEEVSLADYEHIGMCSRIGNCIVTMRHLFH